MRDRNLVPDVPCPDIDHCLRCGSQLTGVAEPGSPQDEGLCGIECPNEPGNVMQEFIRRLGKLELADRRRVLAATQVYFDGVDR